MEDRQYGVPRIDDLRSAAARIRFLSVEPLLENLGVIDLSRIDWVIVGGESGFGARPMQKEWVVSIQNQCAENRIPFFFKQWGGRQKSKTGRLLDGRTYDEMPSRQKPADSIDPGRRLKGRRCLPLSHAECRSKQKDNEIIFISTSQISLEEFC